MFNKTIVLLQRWEFYYDFKKKHFNDIFSSPSIVLFHFLDSTGSFLYFFMTSITHLGSGGIWIDNSVITRYE